MRVNNHVGHNTLSSERQVFLSVGHATSTLLTMSTRKLVTDLRDPHGSHLNLGKELVFLINRNDHLIDNA